MLSGLIAYNRLPVLRSEPPVSATVTVTISPVVGHISVSVMIVIVGAIVSIIYPVCVRLIVFPA